MAREGIAGPRGVNLGRVQKSANSSHPAGGAKIRGFEPLTALAALDEPREAQAGTLLAQAFGDNPMNRAVIGGNRDSRVRVNKHGMTASLAASRRFSFRRVSLAEPTASRGSPASELTGALIALDPGGYPVAPPPIRLQLRCLWGQGLRVMRRWGQLYGLLDACHPKQPHCYLSLIATHPDHQRRGIGGALLANWLEDVDARGMASYLETDRSELVGFYRAAGFKVERELEAFGSPIWCMSRPPMTGS
jgi:ribosomal protein S18 acetylase RimI-like enzyme